MARKLYWEAAAASSKPARRPPRQPRKPRSTASKEYDDGLSDTHLPDDISRQVRNPSSSPPPSPPAEEYMHPADDKYRMVEDELVDTAKLFTVHLHHAHYQKLKRLSRARAVAGGSTIAKRPTVGQPSAAERMESQAQAARSAQRSAETNMFGNDEEEKADPYLQNPLLAGLMQADGSVALLQESVRLPRLVRSPVHERRKTTPVQEEDEGEVDLDAGGRGSPARLSVQPVAVTPPPAGTNRRRVLDGRLAEKFQRERNSAAIAPKNYGLPASKRPHLDGKLASKLQRARAAAAESTQAETIPSTTPGHDLLPSTRSHLDGKLASKLQRARAAVTTDPPPSKAKEKTRVSDVPFWLM